MNALTIKFKELGLTDYVSAEEGYFYDWLMELKTAGYIKEIQFQPRYPLIENVYFDFIKAGKGKNPKDKVIPYEALKGMYYTPDFRVIWNESALDVFYFTENSYLKTTFKDAAKRMFVARKATQEDVDRSLGVMELNDYFSIIEVKGTFASRQNSTAVKFPLLQKLMYFIHKIYVQKAMPFDKSNGVFALTFTPFSYLLTEKKKDIRKLGWKALTLNEYITKINT